MDQSNVNMNVFDANSPQRISAISKNSNRNSNLLQVPLSPP